MVWRSRRSFIVLLQGFSLRRRVALSLALVRLILLPVIFIAVYYLFAMASIVDRIVSVDAPVARNAERAAVEMLDARRAETNYFLLHDPDDIARNREFLRQLTRTIQTCRKLQPEEKPALDNLEAQVAFYRSSFNHAVERLGESNLPPIREPAGDCADLSEGPGRCSGPFPPRKPYAIDRNAARPHRVL